jgi:ornithine cyclodeaminase/alanine dehydrogenase-like protein (mu-crystallin family)
LDGNWITKERTAGSCVPAAKNATNANGNIVCFVGCGAQPRGGLNAVANIFDLEQIVLFGRGHTNQDRIAQQAKARGTTARGCSSG